jgi:hypothetical protein
MSELPYAVIAAVDWSAYAECDGPGTRVGGALRDLLDSGNVDSASEAWANLEEHVFSQGTIYPVAEPTVSVLLAALTEDQPSWRSGRIVDLLFFIVRGESASDPSLQARCRERAREGLWLLARRALTQEGWARDNVLEVIEAVAPDWYEQVRSAVSSQ